MSGGHELHDQPRWVEGRRHMTSQNYELAIEMFANLVQELELEFGPDSLIVAPAWYEYGNALLSAEEENPANDVLGDVKKFAKESAQEGLGSDTFEDDEDDEDVEDDEDETIDNQAVDREDDKVGVAEVKEKCKMEPNAAVDDAEQDQEGEKDLDGDIQLAWECLEASRRLYDMHKPVKYELRLAEIRTRLGDLKRFEGDTLSAIDEYKGALALRNEHCAAHDRALSDAHFSLAVAYIYLSGEEGQEALGCKRTALSHYTQARAVLELWLEAYKANPESVVPVSALTPVCDAVAFTPAFITQLIGDLTETIDALRHEIANPESTSLSGSSTTIGFAPPSIAAMAVTAISTDPSAVFLSSSSMGFFGSSSAGMTTKTDIASFEAAFRRRSETKSEDPESKKREILPSSEDCKENAVTSPPISVEGSSMQIKKKQRTEPEPAATTTATSSVSAVRDGDK